MESESARTLHCECGSEEYHIKWTLDPDGDIWAECADCGRPTGAVEDGDEKILDGIDDADEGDTILFDESGGSSPARKTQAVELKKFLQRDRQE